MNTTKAEKVEARRIKAEERRIKAEERRIKAETMRINVEVKTLRGERKAWLTGRVFVALGWWGLPWCDGPGGYGHDDSGCDGCATRLYARDRADEIGTRIDVLLSRLNPLVGEVVPADVGPVWAVSPRPADALF
ncbi:hypothetical protein [Parafrankia sp. FMc2]|uniref:hypothetical protein n=1 Tax=Parafrankia sp. FMc2 TaxID=3233196 RepID=UPI0034D6FFE1